MLHQNYKRLLKAALGVAPKFAPALELRAKALHQTLREKHRAMQNDPRSMDQGELEQLFEEASQQVEKIIVHQFNMLHTGNLSSLAPSQQAWIARYLLLDNEIKRRRVEGIDGT